MNTSHLARIVIFVVLSVNLTNASPLSRVKRSLEEQSDIAHAVPANGDMQTRGFCPPGIWVCVQSSEPVADKMVVNPESDNHAPAGGLRQGAKETKRSQPAQAESGNDGQKEELNSDPGKCPPGIWVCKRKRLLRKMKKQASKVMKQLKERLGRSSQKCPPGIWVC